MRNKKLIVGIIVVTVFIGFILIAKALLPKMAGKKSVPALSTKKDLSKLQAKKIVSKGKGALTVRMLNSKNIEVPIKLKAFKVIDKRSSIYIASSVGGRMQELEPGTYDIELDTVPQKILKNIKISEGKETIEDIGSITGSLIIKAVTSKKAPAYYAIRVLNPKTNDMITAYMTGRAMEIIPGIYDIEIGISPRLYKKAIKIDAGREIVVDLGCITGTVLLKVVDEDEKNVRATVKVTNPGTNEVVSSGTTNKAMELGKGTYNIEVFTTPRQNRKGVNVNIGEETTIEFVVKVPPQAKPQQAKVNINNR